MIARQNVALVFTNQLRQKLGVMFGDPWTTSGGKALPFHASTRVRLKNVGQIKDTKKNTIGIKIRAQVIKNRLGPPLRVAEFILYFDRGISDYDSWLTVMKDHKLVKTAGAWYTYIDPDTSKEIKFLSKDFAEKLDNDLELKEKIYKLICDKSILKYQSDKLGLDDIIETDKVVDEL
jgi:recombination protein RecA